MKSLLQEEGVRLAEVQGLRREQDDAALALMFHALNGDARAVLVRRMMFGKRLLQCRQRDHLTACLQKALQPAPEPQVAIRVELAEVAGHVPSLALRLDERRSSFVRQVS